MFALPCYKKKREIKNIYYKKNMKDKKKRGKKKKEKKREGAFSSS